MVKKVGNKPSICRKRNMICGACGFIAEKPGQVKYIRTGGVGVYLCKKCWKRQMEWQEKRNKSLPESKRKPILKWT